MADEVPSVALGAVLKKSISLKNKEYVKGYDFNDGVDYEALLASYKYSGFQATSLGLAIEEVNKMVSMIIRDKPNTWLLLDILLIQNSIFKLNIWSAEYFN